MKRLFRLAPLAIILSLIAAPLAGCAEKVPNETQLVVEGGASGTEVFTCTKTETRR